VTNIAAVLAHQEKEVLLFDADRQPTSSEWETERRLNHPKHPKITCIQRYGDIDSTIMELSEKYANIVIDVAGRDSDEFRSALTVADVVLVPIRPSQADLNAVHNTVRLIVQARRINPKISAYCFLNQAPTQCQR
jgi:chromosome partitioning protein